MRVRIGFRAQGVGYVFKLYYVASCLLYSWSLVYPFDVWRGMQENAGRCVMCVRGGCLRWGIGTEPQYGMIRTQAVVWIGLDLFNCAFYYLYLEFLAAVCDSVVQARQDEGCSAAARTDASASWFIYIVHCLSTVNVDLHLHLSRGGQIDPETLNLQTNVGG